MAAAKPSARRYKGFNVLFDYVKIDNEDEPVMALGNPNTHSSFVIPLGSAYKYADSRSGEPSDYLVASTVTIAGYLSLFPDKDTCFRIASAIVDNLPSLIEMPPKPAMTREEMNKKIEQSGLIVDLNGQRIINAG